MIEVIIVVACVACILYLIITTLVEAWASWGQEDGSANSPPADENHLPHLPKARSAWRKIKEVASQDESSESYR